MKAILVRKFGEPEVMRVEDVPEPKPGPGEVLVKVMAIGVNPVEAYIRSGMFYARDLPFTPGTDSAGVVEATGDGVKKVAPGDRVYTAGTLTGAYAEKTLCREAQAHRLPANVTFQQGSALGVPYATAYRALFQKARAKAGETVLIHGASGGVGVAALQLARAAGLMVIGTGGTDRGRELALKEGAHRVFDHRAVGHLDEVVRLTGGGVDVIIEFLANVNLANDLKALKKGGRVVVVGSRGAVEIDPRDAMARDAAILGMSLFNATDEDLAVIHSAVIAGLENNTLRPVIGREMPLHDAPAAHHLIMEANAYGKIVLVA